ncbi:MAG: hypothetical protein ACJ708_00275 [Nitrososphaeraceae archaeon]
MPNVIFSKQILSHMFLQTIRENKLDTKDVIKSNESTKGEGV